MVVVFALQRTFGFQTPCVNSMTNHTGSEAKKLHNYPGMIFTL